MAVQQSLAEVRDATGRRFAYRPAAILGNGSLLATVSARGELERLFWPNVDHGQHLGELRLGLDCDDAVVWLDEEPADWEQAYADGASVLVTTTRNDGVSVEVTDLVTPGEPVLVRGVRCSAASRLLVRSVPSLDGDARNVAGYVDPASGALVFYERGVALAVLLVAPGSTATLREGNGGEASDDIVVHRAPVEGTLAAEVGENEVALVVAAFGATPDEAIARLTRPAAVGFDVLASERVAYDREAVALAEPSIIDTAGVDALYGRSLLVLEQLTDRQTGATIAAPEFDPDFAHSGGYGFVWPRDLAYNVLSLLAAGRGDLARPALRWLAREQAPEGLWLQRYWTDGSLAPSWGLHQLDETGVVVFAYEAAWRSLGDAALDRELWPSARAAGDFLCGFLDPDTGLPLPSVDLWEQTDGQHAYSAAATYGGLAACAAMAARHEPALEARLPGRRGARARCDRRLPLERGARPLSPLALGRALGRARRRTAADIRSPVALSDAGRPLRRPRRSKGRQLAPRPQLAIPGRRSGLSANARHGRRGGARARRPRRRRAQARGRHVRGWQPVAHLDALARPRTAPGWRRGRLVALARLRARSADATRSPPRAGDGERRPGLGGPARLEPRDARARRAARARRRSRRNCLKPGALYRPRVIPAPRPSAVGTATSADGTQIAWRRYGEGERAILFVPTWNLVDSRVVGHQVAALERRATVVTYDPRGAGASERPASGYDFSLHGADALAVLQAAEVERVAVVTASRGINAAVLLAADHPQRFDRLAVVAPYMQLETEPRPPNPEWLESLRTDWRGFIVPFMHAVFTEPDSDEVIAEMTAIGLEATPEVIVSQELELDWQRPARLLGRVTCPTLVVHGEADAPVPVAHAESIVAAMANARLEVIPGGGHRPDIRTPELVNPLLLDFLLDS